MEGRRRGKEERARKVGRTERKEEKRKNELKDMIWYQDL